MNNPINEIPRRPPPAVTVKAVTPEVPVSPPLTEQEAALAKFDAAMAKAHSEMMEREANAPPSGDDDDSRLRQHFAIGGALIGGIIIFGYMSGYVVVPVGLVALVVLAPLLRFGRNE